MKNVLVISYYFPPMGMGGVQRTLKFVKYLHKFGWKPFVLTDTPKVYFARDAGLLDELTPGTFEILRTKRGGTNNLLTKEKKFIFRAERMRKFMSGLGQTFLLPDTKRLWKKKAAELGEEIIHKNNIDLIFATAPPYTDFLIGHELHLKFGIALILDYRDLWVDCLNNFYPTPWHRNVNIKLESEILSAAEKVICINPRIKEMILERYYSVKADDIIVIPHGFDADDFSETASRTDNKMRFTYSGSFLYYYTPEYFLKALAIVFEQNPRLKNKIEAFFVGTFPKEHLHLIEMLKLKDNVTFTGYLNHKDCVSHLMQSDVLWMMINKTNVSDMHSTGKLYEYFGTRKPILACVPNGVAKETLKQYGAAKICSPDEPHSIAKAIAELYDLFEKHSLPEADQNFVVKYDREKLTARLAAEFDSQLSTVRSPNGHEHVLQ